jgi:hypothetical protein
MPSKVTVFNQANSPSQVLIPYVEPIRRYFKSPFPTINTFLDERLCLMRLGPKGSETQTCSGSKWEVSSKWFRFGFGRIDSKEEPLTVYFAHN